MDIRKFVIDNKLEFTHNTIEEKEIEPLQNTIGVTIGPELKDYILNYGYLAYKHIELYGINSKQLLKSDLITQTLYLHKYFPKVSNFIALENYGDGKYIVVSSQDDVFEYDSEKNLLKDTESKLSEYIINRFTNI